MKEKSQIEKKAEEKQDGTAVCRTGRGIERRRPLAQRIGQGISPALSARGLGQPVQCPLYGLAFGQ